MLDILFLSVLVALVVMVIYWSAIVAQQMAKIKQKGAVVGPKAKELVALYRCNGLELWVNSAEPPRIIKRPVVNSRRINETVNEPHFFYGGVDIAVSPINDGVEYQVLSLRGLPSEVRGFLALNYRKETYERAIKALGL